LTVSMSNKVLSLANMRNRIRTARRVLLAVAACAVVASPGAAKPPEIFPRSQIRPGMKGYALTTFRGAVPERFEVEIVGVMKNSQPKQDLYMFKSEDPKVLLYGVTAGMSGSPIYLDGKMACAISYSYPWNKVTIGACTPLDYMIDEGNRKLRGPEQTSIASRTEWQDKKDADPWLLRPAIAAAPKREDGMTQVAVPVSTAGLSPRAFAAARELFAPYGLEPMEGAGGGSLSETGPSKYVEGGNIAVLLATGDTTMSGLCTVTLVDGNKVLGCGHPMFGSLGEVYMPAANADLHAIIPRVNNSFKLATPTRLMGSLIMDHQATIVADAARVTPMIPVSIKIKGPNGSQTFNSNVVAHRFFTPQLSGMMVANASGVIAPDLSPATMKVKTTLKVKGFEPLVFHDYLFSPDGFSPGAIGNLRGLRAMVPILFNPFEPARIERFDVEAEVTYKTDVAVIEAVRLTDVEVPTEKEIELEVVLRPYDGKPYTKKIPLVIPRRLAGAVLKIEVAPGDQARADVAPPDNLAQLVAGLRKTYPGTQLVATLLLPDEGVTLEGSTLPSLPDSALDTIRPGTSSRKVEPYRSVSRFVAPTTQVVQGRAELTFRVADENL
jgi:SpoIVB peptidase S55